MQVLPRWAPQQGVVPLPKASQWDHLVENLGAFDLELREEHTEELSALNEHYSTLGQTLQYL